MNSKADQAPRRAAGLAELRELAGLGAVLALIALAGCGGDMATISGSVTLDGEPVGCHENMSGMVIFQNTAGGPKAFAAIDGSGDYQVSAGSAKYIEPGEYTATVSVKEFLESADGDSQRITKLVTPKKYTSARTAGLRFNVEKGGNRIDLALTSE